MTFLESPSFRKGDIFLNVRVFLLQERKNTFNYMILEAIIGIFGGIFSISTALGGVDIFRWGAGGRWDSGFAGSGRPPPTPPPRGVTISTTES